MTEFTAYTSLTLAVIDGEGKSVFQRTHGPIVGWTPVDATGRRALWSSASGVIQIWGLDDRFERRSHKEHGPFVGWSPVGMSEERVLWRHADGRASLWTIDAEGDQVSYREHGPYGGWTPVNYSDGHLLWRHVDGRASLWRVDAAGDHVGYREHGPYGGWAPVHYAEGRLLWRHADGRASLWVVDADGSHVSYREHGPIAGWLPVRCDASTLTWRDTSGVTHVWDIDERGQRIGSREYAVAGSMVAERRIFAVEAAAEVERRVGGAVRQARPVDLFWVPTARFFELAVDLHERALGGGAGFKNEGVGRLSPAEAQQALRTARNRWAAFLAVASADVVEAAFADLLGFIERRGGRLDGLLSIFLSAWSRTPDSSGLRERGAVLGSIASGAERGDGGLRDVPILDADGGGVTFVDVAAIGRLGAARFDSAADLARVIGSRSTPASAADGGTAEEVFKWGGMIISAVIGGYLGFKGGGSLGAGFGVLTGWVGGKDVGKWLHDGIIAPGRPGRGSSGQVPVDAGPSDTDGSTTGGETTDDRDTIVSDSGDDDDDDDGDGGDDGDG
ncbi:MAG TPA: hypothetical protein PKW35_09820, partial [Nannocystaceae bacterium]|nr:hypothetical protein [Nannocystaceae bacterium]